MRGKDENNMQNPAQRGTTIRKIEGDEAGAGFDIPGHAQHQELPTATDRQCDNEPLDPRGSSGSLVIDEYLKEDTMPSRMTRRS